MKLSQDVIRQGSQLIEKGDLDNLRPFLEKHCQFMDTENMYGQFEKLINSNNKERANKLWLRVAEDYDPAATAIGILFKLAWKILLLLGAIGGIVYLIRVC